MPGLPVTAEEFELFLRAHYDRIFGYAYRVMGCRLEAEDLAQDVCLSLPAKMKGFRREARITTWLYRVVTNAAIDRLRKTRCLRAARPVFQETLSTMAEAGTEQARRSAWLSGAMARLPEELRVTAALLVEEGMTQAEAAKILGVAPGTVAWRMSEIKTRLKVLAEEEFE